MFGLIIIMAVTVISGLLVGRLVVTVIGWDSLTMVYKAYEEKPKSKNIDKIVYGRDGLNFVVKGEKE